MNADRRRGISLRKTQLDECESYEINYLIGHYDTMVHNFISMSESVLLTSDIFNSCLKLVYENNVNEFSAMLDTYEGLKSTVDAWGLIHYLYDFNWEEGIQMYLDKGGKLDILTRDYYARLHKIPMGIRGGQTILHIVAAHCRSDSGRLQSLIEKFPELNIQDWNGNLPVDIAKEPNGFDAAAVIYRARQNDLVARRLAIDLSSYETIPIEWIQEDFLEPIRAKVFAKEDVDKNEDEGGRGDGAVGGASKTCACSSAVIKQPRQSGDIQTFFIPEELRIDILKQIEVLPERPPNSMHRYGKVVLPALDSTVRALVKSLVSPESAQRIFRLHAFYVKYDLGVQTKLGLHMDDSTYTINICLSNDSTGAELVFDELSGFYPHICRRGIIHRGFLKHHVEPLKSGVRENLIIWVTLI